MKKRIFFSGRIFSVLIIILNANPVFCQKNIPSTDPEKEPIDYQIARWFHFKDAAVTITFDDGIRSQFTTAVPLLNERKLKGSFYIVTNYVWRGFTPYWDTLNEVAMQGHEIGSHTKNHADIATLASSPLWADSLRNELADSRDMINRMIPIQKCESFCWPGGKINQAAVAAAKKYYLACRASGILLDYDEVQNPYYIQSMPIYHDTPLSDVNGWVDQVVTIKGWLVERIHGIKTVDDSTGYEPVPVEVLKNHWDYLVLNQQKLWVGTFSEVIKYLRERDSTKLLLKDYKDGNLSMSFSDNIQDPAYSIPLTVKINLRGKLNNFRTLEQNGNAIPYQIMQEDTVNYLVFDAIPNKGDIILYIPVEFLKSYPDPNSSKTIIAFNMTRSQKGKLSLYDSGGTVLKKLKRKFHSGFNSIKFDLRKLSSGKYNYCLEIDNKYTYWNSLIIPEDPDLAAGKR